MSPVASQARWIFHATPLAALALTAVTPGAALAQDAVEVGPPIGVVLGVAGLPPVPSPVDEEACRVTWRRAQLRSTQLPSAARDRGPDPSSSAGTGIPVDVARQHYVEADNLGCLEMLEEYHPGPLLELGDREGAASLAVLRAQCTLGAGWEEDARRQLETLHVQNLLLDTAMATATPEFQALVETVRASAEAAGPVRLTTIPAGATVRVDGELACQDTPCSVELRPGIHHLVVERLGFRRRAAMESVNLEGGLELRMEPGSASEVREQLRSLSSGSSLEQPEFLRLASEVFGAELLLMHWRQDATVHATLYDRALQQVRARARSAGDSRLAVNQVFSQWCRQTVEAESGIDVPMVLGISLGAAAVAAIGVLLVVALSPSPEGVIQLGGLED